MNHCLSELIIIREKKSYDLPHIIHVIATNEKGLRTFYSWLSLFTNIYIYMNKAQYHVYFVSLLVLVYFNSIVIDEIQISREGVGGCNKGLGFENTNKNNSKFTSWNTKFRS